MNKVAKKAGLSSQNLNRLILKETGLSSRQRLINYRIEKSKELLKVPSVSVTDEDVFRLVQIFREIIHA